MVVVAGEFSQHFGGDLDRNVGLGQSRTNNHYANMLCPLSMGGQKVVKDSRSSQSLLPNPRLRINRAEIWY